MKRKPATYKPSPHVPAPQRNIVILHDKRGFPLLDIPGPVCPDPDAVWLYSLLCHLLSSLPNDRVSHRRSKRMLQIIKRLNGGKALS